MSEYSGETDGKSTGNGGSTPGNGENLEIKGTVTPLRRKPEKDGPFTGPSSKRKMKPRDDPKTS
jgi:hypothetical protein